MKQRLQTVWSFFKSEGCMLLNQRFVNPNSSNHWQFGSVAEASFLVKSRDNTEKEFPPRTLNQSEGLCHGISFYVSFIIQNYNNLFFVIQEQVASWSFHICCFEHLILPSLMDFVSSVVILEQVSILNPVMTLPGLIVICEILRWIKLYGYDFILWNL